MAKDISTMMREAVSAVGLGVMDEERNCEDAANVTAREAYCLMFGNCPICEMDWGLYDELLGHARDFVREFGPSKGIEWEEF